MSPKKNILLRNIHGYGPKEKITYVVQGIGAGAVNQALKSIAVARGYVAPSGMDLVCIPAFSSVEVDGESKTAMKLIVEIR